MIIVINWEDVLEEWLVREGWKVVGGRVIVGEWGDKEWKSVSEDYKWYECVNSGYFSVPN